MSTALESRLRLCGRNELRDSLVGLVFNGIAAFALRLCRPCLPILSERPTGVKPGCRPPHRTDHFKCVSAACMELATSFWLIIRGKTQRVSKQNAVGVTLNGELQEGQRRPEHFVRTEKEPN